MGKVVEGDHCYEQVTIALSCVVNEKIGALNVVDQVSCSIRYT